MLKNLITWQNENGLTGKFVASKLGLTQSQYSKIKLGQQKPTVEMAERLAKEFNIENVYILLKK